MKHQFGQQKKPLFDYFDDMEIAQEFSRDPFSEEPRSLSHRARRGLLQQEETEQLQENKRDHVKTQENGS